MDNRYNELNKRQQAQVDGIINAIASWRTKQDVIDRIYKAAMNAQLPEMLANIKSSKEA